MGLRNLLSGTVVLALLGVFFFINLCVIAFIYFWNR